MDISKICQKHGASQDSWELTMAYELVQKINPKVIVEIGVHVGGNMRTLRDVFKPEILVGIETENCYDYSDLDVIIGNSKDDSTKAKLAGKLLDRPIDFLFIDGGHFLEDVYSDYHKYVDLMKKGGIIAFHDISIRHIDGVDIHGFWDVLVRRYKSVAIQTTGCEPGIGLIYI